MTSQDPAAVLSSIERPSRTVRVMKWAVALSLAAAGYLRFDAGAPTAARLVVLALALSLAGVVTQWFRRARLPITRELSTGGSAALYAAVIGRKRQEWEYWQARGRGAFVRRNAPDRYSRAGEKKKHRGRNRSRCF